ncbi:MAG: von Willebrand factor type A domain-containing protein, partial [Bacteroidales bacterium]|nr:von Willebrand factor type A domain-containing protein [Bacteroidales bacterium]
DNVYIIALHNEIPVTSTKSDANGKFQLLKLKAGTYKLKAFVINYNYLVVGPFELKDGQTITKDFSLKPKPAELIVDDLEVVGDVREENVSKVSNYYPSGSRKVKCDAYGGAAYNVSYSNDATYVEHNTESYDVINENNFKEVKNDPLSTLSVDVDRAAYSNVRRFINQNTLPHKDVVRIEEMVNYFDYDYPQPKDEHPFSVNAELHECPWNNQHQLLMLGLQGKEMQSEEIPASNLTFLIDVSGSMNSANKLGLLKKAFRILVNNLREKDRVAIVVYAGAAGTVLESTSGKDKAKIIAALDNLSAGGSTAGGEGIKLAYKIAMQNFIKDGNNRVILATDGDFNVGASSNAEMVDLIKQKKESGVFLTILGFGMGNYKDSRMEQISNAGNGNYAYIDNILEAKKMFDKELWGTLFTIAKDVKIQIEFNPAKVKGYRLIGYENRLLNKEDFNDDKKDAGEIGSGHTVTALYEIIPADSDETVSNVDPLEYTTNSIKNSANMLTVKLRYKDPDKDESKLIVARYKSSDISGKTISNNFKLASAVAQFGMLLRDSEHKGSASFEKTLAWARDASSDDKYGYRNEFVKLVEVAELLKK